MTVVTAAMMTIVAVLAMACADLAHVLVARADAQSAADAAALAGVQELAVPSGSGSSACAIASEYATRNAASLETCETSSASAEVLVEVTVEVGPTLLFGDGRFAHARARAVFGPG